MPIFQGQRNPIFYEIHEAETVNRGTVLLLHGLGSSGEDWFLQLPALVSQHRVITLDLPGHGRSEWNGSQILAEGIATDIVGVLDQIGEKRVNAVGLSLGGLVALQLAIDHPSLLQRLVLVNCFARFRLTVRGLFRGIVRIVLFSMGRMDLMAKWIAHGLFPKDDQEPLREQAIQRIAANDRAAYRALLRMIMKYDQMRNLTAIEVPTLVIAGDDDGTVPLAWKQTLAERIPSAQLLVIPGSGHATPIDASDMFNSILCDFLLGDGKY